MSFYRTFRIVAFLAFLGSGVALHAQGQSFTLEEAVEYGLENRNELLNADFDTYIAEQQVREILASGYPQLNGNVSGQWNYRVQQFLLPNALLTGDPNATGFQALAAGTPISGSAGVQLDQLLFDGTFFIGLQAARTFVDLSKTQRASTVEQLKYNITSAYYQALVAEQQIQLLQTNINRLKTLYDETKALYGEGFVEKLDVERLEVNYNNLLLELTKTNRLVALSKNLLKFQMGMPVSMEIALGSTMEEIENEDIASLEGDNFSYDQRLDYTLVNQQIDLERFNTRRYRAGFMPSAYLFGSYNYAFNGDFKSEAEWVGFDVGALGIRINVPIFDGFRKNALIQQSKLTIKKLDNTKLRLEQAIDLELSNTQTELTNAESSLEALQTNADLAQRVYDVSTIKYKEGVGSSLEVNDASTQLKTAQTNYLSGLLQYYIAKISYDKARGKFAE